METKAVLFDLDGTLLPMDQEEFVKAYFGLLAKKLAPLGYDPNQLVKSLWSGVGAMVKNDGSTMNENRFWDEFVAIYGEKTLGDKPVIEEFYKNEFRGAKVACGFRKEAKEVVELAKEKGRKAVLATNPIFPAIATENRMNWAGLEPADFYFYTTYENSHYSKPNPKYYMEILEKIGCKPEECLMVGNDVGEDMIAETLGMKVFLITDCLINKENVDISKYPNGGFEELKAFIKGL